MADLDLTGSESGDETSGARRRRRRSETEATSSPRKVVEDEVRGTAIRAFDGLAKQCYARDDQELGDAIAEEADAMTEGIVTLTDGVPFLRHPIVIVLHLLVTLLAFGRVGGIMLGRVQARRRAAQAAAEAEYSPVVEVAS